MSKRQFVRVQEKGQVTLPISIRRQLGLKKGDLLSVEATENGVLIRSQEAIAMEALDRLGQALRDKGVTLDDWIESGREIRGQLLEEMYGIKADPA